MEDRRPRRMDRRVIYENLWVNLYVDRVELPGGRIIDEHHILEFDREAVTALVRRDDGALLLVEAYRYTTGTVGWETPAGAVEVGEETLVAAAREVWEETGYETTDHRLVYSFNPMNGIANKVFHVAMCCAAARTGEFDTNEVRSCRWFTPTELQGMIDRQEIRDGYSLAAILWYLNRRHDGVDACHS